MGYIHREGVRNVSNYLYQRPDGELVIMTFGGKDASAVAGMDMFKGEEKSLLSAVFKPFQCGGGQTPMNDTVHKHAEMHAKQPACPEQTVMSTVDIFVNGPTEM